MSERESNNSIARKTITAGVAGTVLSTAVTCGAIALNSTTTEIAPTLQTPILSRVLALMYVGVPLGFVTAAIEFCWLNIKNFLQVENIKTNGQEKQ